ncbi:putative fyve zinc finger protein [Eutypa lata UCREL1]|uniref:RING-type E3 ubiquitin transferase n=1 Tax=Eutypa lata (strain UCR-EL1) TaxID=1287681 RepID=M7T3M2_EUTLA|nr:putative fyve zinc finger protein [Eutypa lata UCREL1]
MNIVEDRSSPTEDRRGGVLIDTPDSEPLVNDLAQSNESRERTSLIPSGEARIPRSDTPRPEMGITLREALDETREPQSGSIANDAVPQITHIAPTLNRDAPSTPIAPAFNPTTDRRSPPEFTLPRWQPDAEKMRESQRRLEFVKDEYVEDFVSAHHHQPHTLPSSLNARVRYLLDFGEQPSSSASASSSSMAAGRGRSDRTGINRPLPPPPPQIAEEDECPVCHYELPSRSLPDFEAQREAHINDCIMQHSTYSPSGGSGRPRLPSGAHAHGTPPPRMTRRTGIFPYTATEKDCVDDAECTICLEEFQVGVPMARLECLCRFHRTCIQACAQLRVFHGGYHSRAG